MAKKINLESFSSIKDIMTLHYKNICLIMPTEAIEEEGGRKPKGLRCKTKQAAASLLPDQWR